MNILVQKLNIYGSEVIAFGSKVTKKEARANGFEPGKMDAYVAGLDLNGKWLSAYGFDFEDAVSTLCKEIRYNKHVA